MNACTLFGWWGFNLWLPGFLSMPAASGGIGLSATAMSSVHHRHAGGHVVRLRHVRVRQRAFGRKRTYIGYLLSAAVLIPSTRRCARRCRCSLLGPFVAFFATGYFSGFGAVTAEIYPTDIRATAQGFTYNLGRLASAAAPFTVGTLAQTRGFDVALSTTSVAFVLAALLWFWIPETRGRKLA